MSSLETKRMIGFTLCLVLGVGGGLAPAGSSGDRTVTPPEGSRVAVSALPAESSTHDSDPFERAFGIRIEAIRLTARGLLLDIRYRVMDPERAWPLLSRGVRLALYEASYKQALRTPETPTLGALRQTTLRPVAGRVYFTLFDNTRAGLPAGAEVRLELEGTLSRPLCVEGR